MYQHKFITLRTQCFGCFGQGCRVVYQAFLDNSKYVNLMRKYLNSKKLEQFASLEEKVSQKDQNPTFFLLSIAHSSYTFFYLPKLLFGKTREILWKNSRKLGLQTKVGFLLPNKNIQI